ncbi:uncharacterized protein [Onthophagus taurus]|uniref:uncharacterized protein n=1 Tax=Onthophagus taurus TaxID=166361 RepID=UPI0039BE224C
MPGIREFRTCCDCNSIVETTHSPGLHDDCECNMDFLGTQYDRYSYKRFLYPQNMKWMQCRYPGISKKTSFKNKHLTAIHSPPWWNLNKFNKISLGSSLNLCTSDEQYQECTKLSSLEMKRAVGLVYPCFIDDNNRNKRKLRSTTNFRDGKKPKELTTVYKRECDMTSLSTSDSGTLCSSIHTQREILQVPSVNLKYNTPETNVECCLVERVIPFKRDNTGYFEVVSPNDNFIPGKTRKSRGKHKKNKVQLTTTTVTTPVSEGLQETKIQNNKKDVLTPIIEYKPDQAPTNYVTAKSYHSIIRTKETSYTPDDIENINYETKRISTLHKEDVKRVSFLELDKFPTKINKDIDAKRLNDIKMEDKSLSAHLSSSSDDGKLPPSITKILTELLLDPEHEKVIKNVLHSLARKAAIRKSLSNTILELKGKEKLGISKRRSSGSIQNVSSSDLDRLHFEKYKASVDVAIKLLEDRMTKKIYDAVKNKEHKRKRKEDTEKYYKDIVTCSVDKESYVKGKARRGLDSQNSLLSFKDLAEKPYPSEDIRTTLAYNCHVKPSTSPFKKNQEKYEHPRRNTFSIPGQNQSNVGQPTNSPGENKANDFEKNEENPTKEEALLKKTESKTKIINSSTQLSNNEFTPMLQNCEELIETNSKKVSPADNSNEDSMDSNNSYPRGFREVCRNDTKRRREDKHPRKTSPDYQVDNEKIHRFQHKKYQDSKTRYKSSSRDILSMSEHPRNSVYKHPIDYCNISPPRDYRDNNNVYENQFEIRDVILSPPDTSISEKDSYGPQNNDNGRLPRIQESKENNKPILNTKTMQPNHYNRFHLEYPDKLFSRNTIEKVDALFNNNKHPVPLDYSLNPSSNSTSVTRTSQHDTHSVGSKQFSTPPISSSNEDEKVRKSNKSSNLGQETKMKFSESTNRCRRLPQYDDNDDSRDYNEIMPPEYYCNYGWYMRPYQNSPMGHYDNLPYMNRIQPKNYTSAHSSQDSLHDPYTYGPSYSERIRYTCRFQGTENANLISFVVFLMLFIGLFQYLNIHIT